MDKQNMEHTPRFIRSHDSPLPLILFMLGTLTIGMKAWIKLFVCTWKIKLNCCHIPLRTQPQSSAETRFFQNKSWLINSLWINATVHPFMQDRTRHSTTTHTRPNMWHVPFYSLLLNHLLFPITIKIQCLLIHLACNQNGTTAWNDIQNGRSRDLHRQISSYSSCRGHAVHEKPIYPPKLLLQMHLPANGE